MQVTQVRWTASGGWDRPASRTAGRPADLVLVFGARDILTEGTCVEDVRREHPGARIFGCSTAGEIRGTEVTDDSVVSTAISFSN